MSKAKLTKVLIIYGTGGENFHYTLHMVTATTLKKITKQSSGAEAAEIARTEDKATTDDVGRVDWQDLGTVEYWIWSEEEAGPTKGPGA